MYSFKLIKPKICSCGITHSALPKEYKPDDENHGVMWNCNCHSTLFTPVENLDTSREACECRECVDSKNPCFEIGQCLENQKMCTGCEDEVLMLSYSASNIIPFKPINSNPLK